MKNAKSVNKDFDLPEGSFYANWSAYKINLILPGWEGIDIEMDQGIRGIRHKCIVEIKDGIVEIID